MGILACKVLDRNNIRRVYLKTICVQVISISIQLALRYEHDNVRANARKYEVTHLDQDKIIHKFMEGLKDECPHNVLAEASDF